MIFFSQIMKMANDLNRVKLLIDLEADNIFQQKVCGSTSASINKELDKNYYSFSIFQTAILWLKICKYD